MGRLFACRERGRSWPYDRDGDRTLRLTLLVAALAIALGLSNGAAAQVIAPTEHLAFDTPESWALQYFTSATLMTGLETDMPDVPGSVAVQLEAGWLPSLTPQEEQVGFAGTAREDLNKAPLFLRPRIRVGLPGRFALIVAGVPPLRTFGLTPRLGALGIEWAMLDTAEWRLAWRVHGETGSVTGAFTCPAAVLASSPGSAGNPTGCTTVSADVVTLRYGSVELDVAHRFEHWRKLTPHVTASLNGIDSHFEVGAHTFGNIDETRLYSSGATWSASAGASIALTSRIALAADLFYTPLTIRRQAGGPETTDGLFNVRGLFSYRIR